MQFIRMTWSKGRSALVAAALLTIVIACSGGPAFAEQEAVNYLDQDGNRQTVSEYTTITSGTSRLDGEWYVVKDSVKIESRVEVKGDVKLVLMDGARLECKDGIHVSGSNALTVYGQNADPAKAGKLIASGSSENAGIGGDEDSDADAKGNCGKLLFFGGWIEADSGRYAAAIGTGNNPNTSSATAAYRDLYHIEIDGSAKVVATGGPEAAGIGSGNEGAGRSGMIMISGNADVTAQGGLYGAGIGGGDQGANATIQINGGTVNATGGSGGPGIGSGDDCKLVCSGISIRGGTVNAQGGDYGAGIGAGDTGNMKSRVYIAGGQVTAKAGKQAAGIGGGNYTFWSGGGRGGDVEVNLKNSDDDSFVHAVGAEGCSAIGHGDGESYSGDLDIGVGSVVRTDPGAASIEDLKKSDWSLSLMSARAEDCQGNRTALIEKCRHTIPKYSYIDEQRHMLRCSYCAYEEEQTHTFDETKPCKQCNYAGEVWTIQLKEGRNGGYNHDIKIAKGNKAILPDCMKDFIPSYREFIGWATPEQMESIEGINLDAPKTEEEIEKIEAVIRDISKPGKEIEEQQGLTYVALYTKKVILRITPNQGDGSSILQNEKMFSTVTLPEGEVFTAPEGKAFDSWMIDGKNYPAGSEYKITRCENDFGILECAAVWVDHTHDLVYYEKKLPTCEERGNGNYWKCETCHRCFLDKACTREIREAQTEIPARGHYWGETAYIWSDDNSEVTAKRTCLWDNTHVIEETVKTDFVETKKATCTENGSGMYVPREFTTDGFEEKPKNVTTDKAPHTWGEGDDGEGWIPKADDESMLIRTCQVCGATEEKEKGHEHDWEHHEAILPTCTDSGMKEYWACKDCGKWYADEGGVQEVTEDAWKIPAKGHVMGDYETIGETPATCTDHGSLTVQRKCTICGEADPTPLTYTTDPLGHEWDNGVVTKAATRLEPGTKTLTCLHDSSHTKTLWIPATGGPEEVAAAAEAEALIGKVRALNPKVWSARSYAAVKSALKGLETILADQTASAAQIKAATQKLDKAVKALKRDQKLTVKKKTIKIKAKKLKKKARTVKPLTVKGVKTKVRYKGVGLNKKSKKALKINKKTGKIKVKKKTKRGTYKMRVTITAAGSSKYEPAKKTVTVVIKVKK